MAIVSFSNKFIFVKSRKVAGTSVEGMLRSVCSGKDITTPVTPLDEVDLLKLGHAPQNYAENAEDEATFNQLVRDEKLDQAFEFLQKMPKTLSNHINAMRLKRTVGKQVWDDCYSFSIERHPYSFAASSLNFRAKKYNAGDDSYQDKVDLSASLQKLIDKDGLKDFGNAKQYRNKDGKIIVNRVIKYENLIDDLRDVLEEIGLDPNLTDKLPAFKSLKRFTLDDARAHFTEAQLEAIYNAQRATFEHFGYEH